MTSSGYRDPVHVVGVVGGGTMGVGIAMTYALGGCDVVLCCRTDQGCADAANRLRRLAEQCAAAGAVAAGRLAATVARVRTTTALAEVATTDHVVEAVSEDVPVKQAIHARLDRLVAPDVVIASAATAIPVDTFAARCVHRERVLRPGSTCQLR